MEQSLYLETEPLDPSMKMPMLMRMHWNTFLVTFGAAPDPLIIPANEDYGSGFFFHLEVWLF